MNLQPYRWAVLIFCIFFESISAQESSPPTFQLSSVNLQGWRGMDSVRMSRIVKTHQKELQASKVILVQESVQKNGKSTAALLASRLGVNHFVHNRAGELEGLGFLFAFDLNVISLNLYNLKTKAALDDHQRHVASLQYEESDFGVVRVINVHLAHERYMTYARSMQIREILKWIDALESKSPSDMIVLGGDFNTGHGESFYEGEFDSLYDSLYKFEICHASGAPYTWRDQRFEFRESLDHFFVSTVQSKKNHRYRFASKVYNNLTQQNITDHNLVVLTVQSQ